MSSVEHLHACALLLPCCAGYTPGKERHREASAVTVKADVVEEEVVPSVDVEFEEAALPPISKKTASNWMDHFDFT